MITVSVSVVVDGQTFAYEMEEPGFVGRPDYSKGSALLERATQKVQQSLKGMMPVDDRPVKESRIVDSGPVHTTRC